MRFFLYLIANPDRRARYRDEESRVELWLLWLALQFTQVFAPGQAISGKALPIDLNVSVMKN
jgi:hypothetical protein